MTVAAASAVGRRESDDAVDERRDGPGASRNASRAAADNIANCVAQAIAERTDCASKSARACAADQPVDRSGDAAQQAAGKSWASRQSERRTSDDDVGTHLIPPS